MRMRSLLGCVLAGTTLVSASALASGPARPPQFVVFAFDGSLMLNRWADTRDFASQMERSTAPDFHFTYFLSATYFLENSRKTEYHGPHHAPGASDIGFGGTTDAIKARIEQVHLAEHEGHEMGSHLCGHFDGSSWSAADWMQDFQSFVDLTKSFLDEKEVVGFRAPYLATSKGLYTTLAAMHYRYDTSQTAEMGYWPEKRGGIWNFPLADLVIAGTAKKTLSMDYNFYASQSHEKPDPANADLYEKQMYETYLNYFNHNYGGNRAPLHIGHHFSLWNGGAYWKAEQRFVREVCGKPEVKCVTYKELADFMDTLDPATLAAYRKGAFPKRDGDKMLGFEPSKALQLDLRVAQAADGGMSAALEGVDLDYARMRGVALSWEVDGRRMDSLRRLPLGAGRVSAVAEMGGIEVLRSTHAVSADGRISGEDLEARALSGDLPEAHEE
jgi:hypothetical protein